MTGFRLSTLWIVKVYQKRMVKVYSNVHVKVRIVKCPLSASVLTEQTIYFVHVFSDPRRVIHLILVSNADDEQFRELTMRAPNHSSMITCFRFLESSGEYFFCIYQLQNSKHFKSETVQGVGNFCCLYIKSKHVYSVVEPL